MQTSPTPARTILHVDMDAFFVSVELLRHPELVGQPVVVGGSGRRGVVAAASYEARRYGIHSAMPSAAARRLCQHAVFLPGDHGLYAKVSGQVRRILETVTPFIEPLSLDEAFLDVTGAARLLGTGTEIAHRLRRRVSDELGLHCSVGVAPTKFVAKLASVAAKPIASPAGIRPGAGVVEVRPGEELAFLHPLPVRAIWGVGPKTLERLSRLGVRSVGDLAELGEAALVTSLGRAQGRHLHELAWGRDPREVEVDRATKSIGHEETFATDRHTQDELHRELVRLADGVASRLRAHGVGARTVTVKVRFAGFHTITRSVTVPSPIDTAHAIVLAGEPLLASVDPTPGVRLLGVSASNLGPPTRQLAFDDGPDDGFDDGTEQASKVLDEEWHAAEQTVDAIRNRFGTAAIGPASAVDGAGRPLRLVRPGAQQWGPGQEPDR